VCQTNHLISIDSSQTSLANCPQFQTNACIMLKQDTVVLIGSGYMARFMLSLTDFYADVRYTSRNPHQNLRWVPPNQRVRFDLGQPDTWSNVSPGGDLLWCFPAVPLSSVQQFAAHIKGSFRKLVILGSTSAYDVAGIHHYPPPWIDESAPINLSKPRVQGEEFLRKECGAIVLRVSGIYGPNRNPLDWIRSGRVSPSRKYVNLIHVEDLATMCLAALERGQAGEVYNVSDGMPRTWNEIYMIARDRWHLPTIPEQPVQESGKRIETRKLRDKLGESLRHRELFASLDVLERAKCALKEGSSRRSSDNDAGGNTPEG